MNQTIEFTYDEWLMEFNPTPYEDLPEDIDEHYIWTAVDGDEGQYCVSEGIHFVNRIRYYVTDIPWKDGIFYNIVDEEE